jgi:large subunit ribosomal protein L22
MEVKASLKNLRSSNKKAKLVTDVVKNLDVEKAQNVLLLLNKQLAKVVLKLINSGVANAENNFGLKKDNLFIKEILVGASPTLKRWMPRAFGRAGMIRKRTSHIKLTLGERLPTDPKNIKKSSTNISAVKATDGEEVMKSGIDSTKNISKSAHSDKGGKTQGGNSKKRTLFNRKAI